MSLIITIAKFYNCNYNRSCTFRQVRKKGWTRLNSHYYLRHFFGTHLRCIQYQGICQWCELLNSRWQCRCNDISYHWKRHPLLLAKNIIYSFVLLFCIIFFSILWPLKHFNPFNPILINVYTKYECLHIVSLNLRSLIWILFTFSSIYKIILN